MRAIVINKDQSLSYSEVPNPVIKDKEVLIEVYASTINRADLLQREGKYPPPKGCPNYPGLEIAGKIVKLGKNCSHFNIGDDVCALLGGGGYAQYVAVDERMVLPMPEGMSYVEASAIPEVYTTAFLNLFIVGKAKKGETLLMNAGASGLASAVIPIAKAFGLRVITTVRGKDTVEKIKYLNADIVVDTLEENIVEVLKKEKENGHPVDLAIDCLGGEVLGECLKHVNQGCRWIQIATLAGDNSNIDFRNVYVKNIKIIGSTLRNKTPTQKGKLLRSLQEKLWPKLENGELKIKIHAVLPIEQADEAQQILYRNENVGKVILRIK